MYVTRYIHVNTNVVPEMRGTQPEAPPLQHVRLPPIVTVSSPQLCVPAGRHGAVVGAAVVGAVVGAAVVGAAVVGAVVGAAVVGAAVVGAAVVGAAVVGAAVVGAVVDEAVVGATVEGGHGLYSPNGAKTGRLQSGLNSPKNLSCPVWSTGPESRGEVRQRRRITSFISSVKIGNWNCEAKILRRFIFTLLQIESFVDVVIMS